MHEQEYIEHTHTVPNEIDNRIGFLKFKNTVRVSVRECKNRLRSDLCMRNSNQFIVISYEHCACEQEDRKKETTSIKQIAAVCAVHTAPPSKCSGSGIGTSCKHTASFKVFFL